MKTENQITLQFWVVKPEKDWHTPQQMRDLGESGIYAPVFTCGQKLLLNMVARFDPTDPEARISAALYAMQNARQIVQHDYFGGQIWGVETYINGEKTPPKDTQ